MNDSKALIGAIGLAYLWIAVRQYMADNEGVAVMFVGYAIAQVGVWMQAR
jgi:hypothetical protein